MSEPFDSDKRKWIMPGNHIIVDGQDLTCVETSRHGCRSDDGRRCVLACKRTMNRCKEYYCAFPVGDRIMHVVFLPVKKKKEEV